MAGQPAGGWWRLSPPAGHAELLLTATCGLTTTWRSWRSGVHQPPTAPAVNRTGGPASAALAPGRPSHRAWPMTACEAPEGPGVWRANRDGADASAGASGRRGGRLGHPRRL